MSDLGNKKIFSENLRYYLQRDDKERKEVCRDLGVSYSTFCDWVNGNKYPRIDKIERLAQYFGIQKSDLIEQKRPGEALPEELVIINRAAKKMSAEDRKKLLAMAKLMFQKEFEEDEEHTGL